MRLRADKGRQLVYFERAITLAPEGESLRAFVVWAKAWGCMFMDRFVKTIAIAGAIAMLPLQAGAKTLSQTCRTNDGYKYEVAFDTNRKALTTTHKLFNKKIEIERMEENDAGILVWGVMHNGPSKANLLVHFGKQRWAKRFTGYTQQDTDTCL